MRISLRSGSFLKIFSDQFFHIVFIVHVLTMAPKRKRGNGGHMAMLPLLLAYAVRPVFVIYGEDMDKSQVQQHLVVAYKGVVNEMRVRDLMNMSSCKHCTMQKLQKKMPRGWR